MSGTPLYTSKNSFVPSEVGPIEFRVQRVKKGLKRLSLRMRRLSPNPLNPGSKVQFWKFPQRFPDFHCDNGVVLRWDAGDGKTEWDVKRQTLWLGMEKTKSGDEPGIALNYFAPNADGRIGSVTVDSVTCDRLVVAIETLNGWS